MEETETQKEVKQKFYKTNHNGDKTDEELHTVQLKQRQKDRAEKEE